jgi:hypothetical protein
VHDVLEHIGIPAGWHRLKERPRDSGAPIGDARSVEDRGGSLNHGFGVEQYPARLRPFLQYGSQQATVATADIDDGADAGEVVCGEQGRDLHV